MPTLFEAYRPKTLDEVVGQDKAIAEIRRVLARGWGGRAWWITGPSGSGKSTLARIIAAHGADPFFITEVDAQRLTPAELREHEREMRYRALGSKPGKAYVVNEAHGLRKDAIRLLLVLLEELPEYACWIFTTTKAGEIKLFDDDETGDAAPLLSRCVEISLENGDQTQRAFARRAMEIAHDEGLDGVPLSVYERAVGQSNGNFRRVLQRIESGSFRGDALATIKKELDMIRSTKGPIADKKRAELTAAIAMLER